MLVVLIILSLGLLGGIIYFGFSPKSSKLLKLSAFIAMGLIAVAVGICSIVLIIGPAEETDEIILPIFEDSEPAPKDNNTGAIWAFVILLLAMIGLIFFLNRREQKSGGSLFDAIQIKKPAASVTPETPVFHDEEFSLAEDKKSDKPNDDEDFSIDIK